MQYEFQCRECSEEWVEEYKLEKCPRGGLRCPVCDSEDTFRCVTTSGAVIFKGAGWSPDGYYKNMAYDAHKAQGKSVTLYDRKEDILRDMRGEAGVQEKRKLLKQNEAAKRHLGPDSALTQEEADKKIKAAVERVKV